MQTHPSSSEADRALPRLLSRLVDDVPGIENALIFTYDGLLRAFSPAMRFEDAERLAAITNQMRQYSNAFGNLTKCGQVEALTVRVGEDHRTTHQLLALQATSYSGLALTIDGRQDLRTAVYPASRMLGELAEHLPEQAPGVGAPLALMGTRT